MRGMLHSKFMLMMKSVDYDVVGEVIMTKKQY